MNERLRELVKKSGGEFWQRMDSNGVVNPEAFATFDPPETLEKLTELIVRECMEQLNISNVPAPISAGLNLGRVEIKEHFGVEE